MVSLNYAYDIEDISNNLIFSMYVFFRLYSFFDILINSNLNHA